MTKIKTSDLEGEPLNWAVAEAVGDNPVIIDGEVITGSWWGPFEPSVDWAQCGPLLDEFKPDLEWIVDGTVRADIEDSIGYGSTHLQAVCRAIVAAKMGDEVDVPEELV